MGETQFNPYHMEPCTLNVPLPKMDSTEYKENKMPDEDKRQCVDCELDLPESCGGWQKNKPYGAPYWICLHCYFERKAVANVRTYPRRKVIEVFDCGIPKCKREHRGYIAAKRCRERMLRPTRPDHTARNIRIFNRVTSGTSMAQVGREEKMSGTNVNAIVCKVLREIKRSPRFKETVDALCDAAIVGG